MAAGVPERFDLVIVGAGIAGGALATVMARAGYSVLLLERSTEYRDRVRGEFYEPWGVAEARRLGVLDSLAASGVYHTLYVPYDETLEPGEAVAAAVQLGGLIPDIQGSLGLYHPAACDALAADAKASGATVLRGVSSVEVEPGEAPRVRYHLNGVESEVRSRLVVGADGRDSKVRRDAGISLEAMAPRLIGAGLRIEGIEGWPEHIVSIGTEGDAIFFILPQPEGRARLYLMYAVAQERRLSGPGAGQAFLANFRLKCVPASEAIARAKPAGPCAAFPMNDTWTKSPLAEGLVLVGDAAGYSDPHLGQGLSVALRDVRVLSEVLLSTEDWSAGSLSGYAEERDERMRRLRFCNAIATELRGTFGPEAQARRRQARRRMQEDPELALWRLAAFAGPEAVPASAFDERIPKRLFAK
jgi:2-polyprenyl-6-methoxyphenol hydroxylase-like FAD-dependent oxidoreductase